MQRKPPSAAPPSSERRGGSGRLSPFLSPIGAWSYGVGTAIGWGSLVVTTNQYLLQAGPLGSVLGIIIGTLVMVVVAFCYADMMNRYPDAGGSYTYVRHVLGSDYGFLLAWFLVLTYMTVFWANATSLPLFSRYFLGGAFRVGYLYSLFGYDVYAGEVLLTMAVIALIGILCTGDKRIKQYIMVALALAFTAGIVVCFFTAIFSHGQASASFDPLLIPDKALFGQVAAVALMTPWAFIGFESISHSTEEFAFSRKHSLRVLLVVIATTALLYLFVTVLSVTAYPQRYESWFAYISDLGSLEGIEGLPPFYAAYCYLGNAGIGILMISLLALVLTSLIGNIVALSRLLVALGRDGLVPDNLAELNAKGTPYRTIIAISGVSLLIPLLGRTPIGWIVDITTIGACIVYGLVSLSEYRIGKSEESRPKTVLGALGFAVMIAFGLATLLPSLVGAGSLAMETYFLVTIWSILGFIYFRSVLRKNVGGSYGDSFVVWAFLLALVLFTSTAWMQITEQTATAEAFESIRAHLVEQNEDLDADWDQGLIDQTIEQLNRDNLKSSLIMAGMFIVAVSMMLSNHRYMRRRREESERALGAAREAAYTDPLTRVKSKHAFMEYEGSVDAAILAGEAGEFAVVVCDVNGLKFVNDTLGHAAGDEYIKAACEVVCRHFKHSPVFRVGGDEFAVIPEGGDLGNLDEVIAGFNREVEGNIGTASPVVSAGTARYIPGRDRTFHAVFERADACMYQRKTQLKALGAATRD